MTTGKLPPPSGFAARNGSARKPTLRQLAKKNCPEICEVDFLAITRDWEQVSRRKSWLIDRKIARTATTAHLCELQNLKRLTEARGELFAPLESPPQSDPSSATRREEKP